MNVTRPYFVSTLLLLSSLICLGCAECAAAEPEAETPPETMFVYVGTYAAADNGGIHIYKLNMESGTLLRIGATAGIKNPSFQAVHPQGKFLYSVSETQDHRGQPSGSLSAFAIDQQTGKLRFINEQSSMGAHPCHVIVDQAARHVMAANYTGGSIVILPIRTDGGLDTPCALEQHTGSSINPRRQKQPHAHCVNLDPANKFLVSADLGIDKVMIYRYDGRKGSIILNPHMPAAGVKPGAGPRHFAFHSNGRYSYVINELNSTITAFDFDAEKGTLKPNQEITTLPAGFEGQNSTAEISISPNGRFLYGSNRGHHSIVVYAINPDGGRLTYVSHHPTQGEQPRNFAIDPTGTFLLAANQRSGNVVVFRIDRTSGKLTPTGEDIQLEKPVCVTFLAI